MQAPKDWGRFRTVGVDKNKEEVKGVAQNLWSCDPHPMALVDPPPACQRNLRLLGGAGEVRERRQKGTSASMRSNRTLSPSRSPRL